MATYATPKLVKNAKTIGKTTNADAVVAQLSPNFAQENANILKGKINMKDQYETERALREMVHNQIHTIIELQEKIDMMNYSKSDDDRVRALDLEMKVAKLIAENQDLKKENQELKRANNEFQNILDGNVDRVNDLKKRLNAVYRYKKDEDLQKKYDDLKEDYDRLDNSYKKLYEENEQQKKEFKDRECELQGIHLDQGDIIRGLQKEVKDLKEDYDRLDEEYKKISDTNKELHDERVILQGKHLYQRKVASDLEQKVKDLEKANEDIRNQCRFYKTQYEDLSKEYHEKWNQVKIENERLVQRIKDLELDNLNLNSENESYHSCIKMLTEKEKSAYDTYKEEEK